MEELTVFTKSPEETQALAGRLAAFLSPGDLLVLRGSLGAGKTTFAKGLGKALKAERPIISPSFTLAREVGVEFASGEKGVLIHVDAWRLKAAEKDPLVQFEALGIDDDFESHAALVVAEWGEGVVEGMAGKALCVSFELGKSDGERMISFEPQGFEKFEGFSERMGAPLGSLGD